MSTDEGDSRNQEGSGASGVTTDDKSMKANQSGSNDYEPTTTKTTEESTVAMSTDEGDSRNREGSGASGVATDDKSMKAKSDNNNEESGGESYIMSFEYTRVTKRI